jgi:TetR/AcrR family transcriptional regulator
MTLIRPKSGLGTRRQPEISRQAIFDAALEEFSLEGVAGGRMDRIATSAGVNKALLYYYFKDKETLYGALLDHVFSGLLDTVMQAMDKATTPGEQIMAWLASHFDYVSHSPSYPRLVQYEMMRANRTGSPHIKRLVSKYFQPITERLMKAVEEGIAAGEFRPLNPRHFVSSAVAVITNYFLNVPLMRLAVPGDPLSQERVAERRVAVADFVVAALFMPGKSAPLPPRVEPAPAQEKE